MLVDRWRRAPFQTVWTESLGRSSTLGAKAGCREEPAYRPGRSPVAHHGVDEGGLAGQVLAYAVAIACFEGELESLVPLV
ncbi:hypothetical protein D3C78_1871010 [compost metagenome]